jgi:2-polyprenyl-6-methoxyphenol hydroxylase-like FAD-dependent oxidoreductase
MVFPEPNLPTGGALSSYENGTWMLTVYRLDQLEPPTDLAALMELGARFVSPALTTALQAGAEPVGQMDVFRYPGGAWRRYDKMQRFPAGLLVFGDAICSLSPIYTQGMTVAALEAVALRECLSQSDADVSKRFFDAAAGLIGPQWVSNQFNDLYIYTANDRPAVSEELLFLREEVLLAAESSAVLTEKLFRTMNLVDPPADYSPLLV